MADITDSLGIRGNRLKNRIAMLPMYTFSFSGDDDDFYGGQHLAHYNVAASGGPGLMILQATNVLDLAASQGMWSPGSQNILRQIASHARTCGVTAMMQLSCGNLEVNELSTGNVETLQAELKLAAQKAFEFGFHGVEYHCGHGYTLCKFLDAGFNKRCDDFGGNLANRARVLTDILPGIRDATSENFIVAVRMGAYLPTQQDGLEMARHLEAAGIDLFDITFAMQRPENDIPRDFPFSPVTYSGYIIKQAVSAPVIGVNGIRSGEQARMLIERGYADIAGIGRAMLADPQFAAHVLSNVPINACLGCARCKWFTDHTICPARHENTRV